MQNLISRLDKQEVLRYLGYGGTKISGSLHSLLDRCMETTLQTIQPKYDFRRFLIQRRNEGILLDGTDVVLRGADIQDHLGGCDGLYLLCATVGFEMERLIRRSMLTVPDEGVIFDSCATVATEQLAGLAEREIARLAAKEGLNLTRRFSPGYGDLPIQTQADVIRIMDAPRKIGLSLNESMLLTPQKSVTAILGLADSKQNKCSNQCDICGNRNHCAFRKGGTRC